MEDSSTAFLPGPPPLHSSIGGGGSSSGGVGCHGCSCCSSRNHHYVPSRPSLESAFSTSNLHALSAMSRASLGGSQALLGCSEHHRPSILPAALGGSQALLTGSDHRRPSIMPAALGGSQALLGCDRRPSALLQLANCGTCGEQRRYLISIMRNAHQQGSARHLPVETPASPKLVLPPSHTQHKPPPDSPVPSYTEAVAPAEDPRRKKRKHTQNEADGVEDDALTAGLSALYAKLLVVLGIAFPIAEVISDKVPSTFDQGYYLYLYLGSLAFMLYMYATLLRDRAVFSIVHSYNMDPESEKDLYAMRSLRKRNVPLIRYGSFYLRAGAIGFGIGSMIYSGLEFGQYFELQPDSECHNVLMALTPATRMVLTIVQMQFIFLNNRIEMGKYIGVARFGLMHMIATNMCEWLHVLVEEAKHEILHLSHKVHLHPADTSANDTTLLQGGNSSSILVRSHREAPSSSIDCLRTNIMGSLVQNASPFLFPCTIEYSLICAVILYEMWKNVSSLVANNKRNSGALRDKYSTETSMNNYKLPAGKLIHPSDNHHFSVDCASAHRGLFSGIIILVLTIISLIMFFVLIRDPLFSHMAVFEVNICELIMYVVSTVAVIVCMVQMRDLEYRRGKHGFELDGILLVVAQTGMYVYCLFSMVGSYFSDARNAPGGLLTELCSLIQTTCQTIFVLDAWWRRCENMSQVRRKPGRQLVTFLLIANLSMWTINTLEKNRAEFHPNHLEFYGVWAWTIITHVSMPLAIFYRFHSTVCLLEIWKTAYKIKSPH